MINSIKNEEYLFQTKEENLITPCALYTTLFLKINVLYIANLTKMINLFQLYGIVSSV